MRFLSSAARSFLYVSLVTGMLFTSCKDSAKSPKTSVSDIGSAVFDTEAEEFNKFLASFEKNRLTHFSQSLIGEKINICVFNFENAAPSQEEVEAVFKERGFLNNPDSPCVYVKEGVAVEYVPGRSQLTVFEVPDLTPLEIFAYALQYGKYSFSNGGEDIKDYYKWNFYDIPNIFIEDSDEFIVFRFGYIFAYVSYKARESYFTAELLTEDQKEQLSDTDNIRKLIKSYEHDFENAVNYDRFNDFTYIGYSPS